MSIDEMKWKITSSLDKLSEEKLEALLRLVKEEQEAPQVRYDINSALEKVLKENEGLLKRLAQ